ncbi:MAG: BatA domain-containing protein [Planctomycetota bacterium]
MIDGFVNPLLAWGALLAAVPLVIHILNRRRHRPVPFGAMRFVVAALQRTRRRTQLESLLLLLLRMLAVALLAIAIARPFVGGDSLLSGLTESRRDVVLVVDTSASTGYREGLGRVLDRVLGRARTILDDLDESAGDRVRLVIADDAPRVASSRSVREARAVLDSIDEPSPTGSDLAGAFALALECADEWGAEGDGFEIRLVTDLQRRNFERGVTDAVPAAGPDEPGTSDGESTEDAAPTGPRRSALEQALDRVEERGFVVLVDDQGPGTPSPPNAGVVAVAVLGSEPSIDAPSRVEVAIENHGVEALADLRVSLEVEGERLPVRSVDVAPGARAEVVFQVRWQSAGENLLRASIATDGLEIDDERVHVAVVSPPVRVVLVDGAPSDEALELDEVGLLAAVLAPPSDSGLGADQRAPFEPRVVLPAILESGQVDLDDVDVLWLANVGSVTTRTIERLTEWVRGGGALVFSMGDSVAPASYDQRFYSDDGSALLPARLLDVRSVTDRRREYWRVEAFDETHPALRFFADERFRRLLVEVPVFAYVGCVPLPDAHVLATLDDGGAPLLVERAFGRGRVFLLTTTIDPAWTRLPESPKTLVPLSHEWMRHAARDSNPPHDLDVGEPIVVETAGFPRRPALVLPSGARRPVDAQPQELPDGRWSLVLAERAGRPGAYAAEVDGDVVAHFAVRFDTDEGALARILPTDLAAVHRALVPATERRDEVATAGTDSGELWRPVAAIVLVLLVLESLFAALVGRRRRPAHEVAR